MKIGTQTTMSSFFLKLLIGNVALLVWYLPYQTVLRRFTHYQLNRAYLLAGLAFSVTTPFLDINPLLRQFSPVDIVLARSADYAPFIAAYGKINRFEDWRFCTYTYTLGVLALLLRMSVQFFSIVKLHRGARNLKIHGFQVKQLQQDASPFSFWRYIYLNPGMYTKTDLIMILQHENIHVRQWHTVDVLLTRLTSILCWFNPAMPIIGRTIQQNLEYIADREVLLLGIDRKGYQYSLLGSSLMKPSVELKNFYTNADLKRRIVEMNRTASRPISVAWYGLVSVSIIICLCLANGFQGHIAGHHSFYRQMVDPAFLKLQAKAGSIQLREDFPQFQNGEGNLERAVIQGVFSKQMEGPVFRNLPQEPDRQ